MEVVLTQKDNSGREYVVANASRSNNTAEANYSSYEGETLVAVWAIAHLPIEGTVHPELAVVPKGLPCFMSREKKGTDTMFLCDQYQRGWNMTCLRPPLTSLPSRQWSCPHY